MKSISVEITQAKIKSFSVTMNDDFPEVTASISLLTAGGKEISTFQVSTQKFYGTTAFDLPAEMILPIKSIAGKLETVVTNICNSELRLIEVK